MLLLLLDFLTNLAHEEVGGQWKLKVLGRRLQKALSFQSAKIKRLLDILSLEILFVH